MIIALMMPHYGGPIELELLKGRYANERIAIQLLSITHQEPFATLTVNVPEIDLEDDELLIKGYSENAEVSTAIMEQTDLFVNTGRIINLGYVNVMVWKFKDPKTLDKIKEL